MDKPATVTSGVDISIPHPARMYDYWLGGKDHYAADRRAADAMSEHLPGIAEMARANHRFVQRAVRMQAAELGIRQFVNIGCGIPSGTPTHRVAQAVDPTARVLYVDPDPVVAAHSRALLASHPRGVVQFLDGSINDLSALLDDPELNRIVDLRAPVSFNVMSNLMNHNDDEAAFILNVLKDAMAPGSCLVIAHGTADFDPENARRATDAGDAEGVHHGARTHAEFSAFFDGLELLAPGAVSVAAWRPDAEETVTDPRTVLVYGGVGRKR